MSLDQVDTPALLIDLDAFERNLNRLATSLAGSGVRLRPHAKTHKSVDVGLAQMARGAVGLCCQKTSEAEILVAGGIPDVLISNEVVGATKLARVAALARRARIGICVDDAQNLADLSLAASAAGSTVHVLVELNVGANRCGVDTPDEVLALARAAADLPGVSFDGIQAYHGAAQHLRGADERRAAIGRAGELTDAVVDKLAAAGLACRTIGGAGTGTWEIERDSGLWNELQAGSYIFMDADYGRNHSAGAPFEHSLFVWSTVMSSPRPDRAILDAGLKASSVDSGLPLVHARNDLVYAGASDEHGRLEVSGPPLKPGEKLRLIPGHCDPTVNLHDWYVGYRGDRVEVVWPVSARGALF